MLSLFTTPTCIKYTTFSRSYRCLNSLSVDSASERANHTRVVETRTHSLTAGEVFNSGHVHHSLWESIRTTVHALLLDPSHILKIGHDSRGAVTTPHVGCGTGTRACNPEQPHHHLLHHLPTYSPPTSRVPAPSIQMRLTYGASAPLYKHVLSCTRQRCNPHCVRSHQTAQLQSVYTCRASGGTVSLQHGACEAWHGGARTSKPSARRHFL